MILIQERLRKGCQPYQHQTKKLPKSWIAFQNNLLNQNHLTNTICFVSAATPFTYKVY